MIKVHPLTVDQLEKIQPLYARFSARAKTDYNWHESPVDFDTLHWSIQSGWLHGYTLENTATGQMEGLMLYRREAHRSIEINLIHWEEEDNKAMLAQLMPRFIKDTLAWDDWDVISYAMLGRQQRFIRTIPWYGFKALGQTIFKFDSLDVISLQIMQKQPETLPGPEYAISYWKPEYAEGIALCIYEAFRNSADAEWDPRFRSLESCHRVVDFLQQGLMGPLCAPCSAILLHDDVPAGFCFVLQSSFAGGNIPLVGIRPNENRRGLGRILLKHALNRVVEETVKGRLNMFTVDATTDTDNWAALNMYRRLGFKEEHNYPHAYLSRERAMAYKPGQWCFPPD